MRHMVIVIHPDIKLNKRQSSRCPNLQSTVVILRNATRRNMDLSHSYHKHTLICKELHNNKKLITSFEAPFALGIRLLTQLTLGIQVCQQFLHSNQFIHPREQNLAISHCVIIISRRTSTGSCFHCKAEWVEAVL
ncbi:uncharacterized protein PHALS_14548 [Plasmopara halstedii]|uniref:Uncharacterized protein n=1 Tax=Plasmopara halstedii TaxID=4781 RepID=A0A0P1AWE6_PLAHL|nr:uncharacterized protein PHALS_14548 [Plasmopara halstedii]CEG44888.1 hypothetical protein PHALS_14548 [Plasmopara halstedii]|eukprot:XP_024581257.1 hypothetical protein PHALS_14548 [Plasmopara halstedii]